MKEGRKPEYRRKPLATSFRKCHKDDAFLSILHLAAASTDKAKAVFQRLCEDFRF